MPMDGATLLHLLRGNHIDMPGRIERGLWPHPPIPFEQCVKVLATALEHEEWFPSPPSPDGAVREGGRIHRLGPNHFECELTGHAPWNPRLLTRRVTTTYNSAREAAEWFLRKDLLLPGDLDGWSVIENGR